MSFDLLPKFLSVITNPGERQLNEPGFNAPDNCGPAAGSVLMQVLGYPDIEPQAWTDYEYWPTYRGGETYAALNDFIASHYPNPPTMTIESATDQLAAIDRWGSAGLLVMGLFWSNDAAQFQSYRTGIGHFALILGYDGTTVTVWNPEWGVQTMSLALFKGSSQNSFNVCHRPILGGAGATAVTEVRVPQEELMTNSALTAMFRLCYAAFEHRTVEDGNLTYQEIKDHVSRVNADQTNLDEEIQHFIAGSKAGGNYKLAVAGPAGPKGDPGQPAPAADLSKLSPKGHTHLVEPDV